MKVMQDKEVKKKQMPEEAIEERSEDLAETEAEVVESEVNEGAADAEPEAPVSVEELEAALESVTVECGVLKDQLLRARAEFDNYRKRIARDTERIRATAAESLIRDILPVADNLERALEHVDDKSASLAQGVDMVLKQITGVLTNHGVTPIAALGTPFDPKIHEALTHQPSDEYPADVVAAEFMRGYLMGDQVIRPSKVVVSSGPPEGAGDAALEEIENESKTEEE